MAHLCVPQNQALGVCRGFVPDIQICGTHRRKDLVNATIISNAEEEELYSPQSSRMNPFREADNDCKPYWNKNLGEDFQRAELGQRGNGEKSNSTECGKTLPTQKNRLKSSQGGKGKRPL